jgi:putative transposase
VKGKGALRRFEKYEAFSALGLEMPRNARIVWPGIPYHVTQRGTNGQTVFYSVADRKTYLDLLRVNLGDCNVRIPAFCLMSNHVKSR